MKNLLLLFLLSTPFLGFSQEEYPIFSEGNTWEIKEEGFDWSEFSHVSIVGDTMIDDKPYKIIGDSSWGLLGFGYDEGKKTFFRPAEFWNYWNYSGDMILYDFNLGVGDTFYLPPQFYPIEDFPNLKAIVLEIDSVELLDGSLRKRYNFGTENNLPQTVFFNCLPEEWTWTDGIGDPIYPVYAIMDCFESVINLDCYSYFGQALHGGCLYLPTEKTNLNTIEIFPNPFTNEIKILDEPLQISSCVLMDINGKKVATSTSNNLSNLEALSSGIYILQVEFKDEFKLIYKMVK